MKDATITISPLEILVLKKLVLVNHALGTKLSGNAGAEQKALTLVLNEITLRAELAAHKIDAAEASSS